MSKINKSRYRLEGKDSCIDVRLKNTLQLFDSRDPAPFRERDIDPDAVEYLVAAAEDIPYSQSLKIVFHFSEPQQITELNEALIESAIHNHFSYEVDLLYKQHRKTRKRGLVFLLLGWLILIMSLSLSQLANHLPDFWLKPVLMEGLVISGWVALWRPVDLFLFDWWPLREKMKCYKKLSKTPVQVIRLV